MNLARDLAEALSTLATVADRADAERRRPLSHQKMAGRQPLASGSVARYLESMSAKQQLAEAVASLPESASLEDAFDRLYRAFKEKLRRQEEQPRRRPFGIDAGRGHIAADFDAPLPDEIERAFSGST